MLMRSVLRDTILNMPVCDILLCRESTASWAIRPLGLQRQNISWGRTYMTVSTPTTKRITVHSKLCHGANSKG